MERRETNIDALSKEELGDIIKTQTLIMDTLIQGHVRAKGILDYVLRNNSDSKLHNRCYEWIKEYEKLGIKLEESGDA